MKKEITEKYEPLTCAEAAQRMRISRDMVYKLIRTKQIPVIKIGATSLIRDIDVERFLDNHLIM